MRAKWSNVLNEVVAARKGGHHHLLPAERADGTRRHPVPNDRVGRPPAAVRFPQHNGTGARRWQGSGGLDVRLMKGMAV